MSENAINDIESLKQENFSLREENERLTARITELEEKFGAANVPVSAGSFTREKVKYEFSPGVKEFIWAGSVVTVEEALKDKDLLSKLVEVKASIIQKQED